MDKFWNKIRTKEKDTLENQIEKYYLWHKNFNTKTMHRKHFKPGAVNLHSGFVFFYKILNSKNVGYWKKKKKKKKKKKESDTVI